MSRRLYALFGLLSTLVGLAVGHFVASLLRPDSSPLLAVGSFVVDLGTEGSFAPIKDWAIEKFGENDKIFLLGTVMLGVAVFALVAGVLTRVRFAYGAALLVLLVLVSAAAVVDRPQFDALDLVPAVLTALAAVAALWWLHRTANGLPLDPRARSTVEVAKEEGAATGFGTSESTSSPDSTDSTDSTETPSVPGKRRAVLTKSPVPDEADGHDDDLVVISPGAGTTEPQSPRPSRRGVLIAGGVLAATAAVLGGAGRWIGKIRARAEDITLPPVAAGEAAPALPQDLRATYPAISPLQVPNGDFYRVDTRLDTPVVDSESWSLEVGGDVENSFSISFDELLEMPMVERDITLTCVSNSVGGKFVGAARWLGVPLQSIIDRANPGSGVDQMVATDYDGMTIGTPYDLLTDGREALLAIGMNGVQLPREHGFPVRIVVPGLYGFISATKWVTKLDFTTYADTESYWTERGWDEVAPIKPSARIDTPKSLSTAKPGKVLVGGVAWAQNDGGVSKIQVRVDGGAWQDAETGPEVNSVYWRQWYAEVDITEGGRHSVSARVVDGNNQTQTDARALPYPGGSSGIHQVLFTVE